MATTSINKSKLISILHLGICLFIAIILSCCANEKAPEGGKKDITPPKAKKIYPANKSLHFAANKIQITFNKYIQSSGFAQTLISPPLDKRPDFKLSNKTLTIKFKSKLRDSTTYTINFADDIKDVNEGNIMSNFTYVFSTGDFIDSQKVSGKVYLAKDNSTVDGAIVSLYPPDSANAIKRSKPFYFAKTDKSGTFQINNIKAGDYWIFALKDDNYNYIFDQPNELIGFTDTLISLNDTFQQYNIDTLTKSGLAKDSVKKIDDHLKKVDLYLFSDGSKNHYLGDKAIAPGYLQFYYSQPVINFTATMDPPSAGVLWYPNVSKDTINYWYSGYYDKKATFFLSANDSIKDTTTITLTNITIDSFNSNPKNRLSTVNHTDTARITKSNKENYILQELYKPIKITFTRPIIEISDSKPIAFYEDSVKKQLPGKFLIDEPSKLSVSLDFMKAEDAKYTIEIPDSVFKDILGSWNRKIIYKFKTSSKDTYGNINLTLKTTHTEKNYLVKLLNGAGATIKEIHFTGEKEKKINIPNIDAGDYKISAVDDTNNNGQWDTGNFKTRKQPEPIINFKEVHTLKGNWDLDIEVTL